MNTKISLKAFLLCCLVIAVLAICSLPAYAEDEPDPATPAPAEETTEPTAQAAPEPKLPATGGELYPSEVRQSEENGQMRLEKVYLLTAKDDPADIPTGDFERDGYTFTLLDVLKTDLTVTDTKEHRETITKDSDTKDMAEILLLLEATLPVDTGDGYSGELALDHTSIAVEAAGYANKSYNVTASRTYPNLADADVSLLPKTVEENGRTLTLTDVSWQTASTNTIDGQQITDQYTAQATYTTTAKSSYATGYVVTAQYYGDVTKISSDTVQYVAVFRGTPGGPKLAGEDKGGLLSNGVEGVSQAMSGVNLVWLLIPLFLGLGVLGYFLFKRVRDKRRGYK